MGHRPSPRRLAGLAVPVHVLALIALMCAGGSPAVAQSLPHNIPDFTLDSSRAAVRSVQSGDWSNPSTWQSGAVPTANHVVHVDPGHTVTIDTTAAVAYTLAVHGTLRVNPAVDTRLTVTNLMVMGDHGMPSMAQVGRFEVGTAAVPVAAGVTAEIVIANTATGGGVADPEQFGTGIINFGKLTMHGAPLSPTFLRLAVEPRVGHTTLTLSDAVSGWRAGDRIVIPDTRHMKESETTGSGWINAQNQWEERTIQSVSADGRTLTLTSALSFDHLGARDLNNVLDFLPHVGNLTRNVVVRSASATGTRGHMMSVHTADTDIRFALFRDLGRTKYTPLNTTTNMIGRYPIHMHHNRGPLPTPANGYQFTLVGNAVDGGSAETQFKWGIAIHNSHYGLIRDNVVYNYNGSSIATEDGSESFNLFDHNFALRGMGEPNNSVSEARSAMGTEGVGFWFRGPNNYVRNNVAANFQNPTTEAAYGYVLQFIRLGNVATPNFKGADPAVAGQFTTRNGNNMPLLQFENNEAYGAMQGGLTYWWLSSLDPQPATGAQESVIKDLKIWHVYNKAVYYYPGQKVTFDGLVIRGKFSSASRCCGNGVYGADYSSKGLIIRNSDIQGMDEGITAPEAGFGPEPNLTIENTYLRNDYNLLVPTNGSVNGCWMQNKLIVVSNTRFDAPPGRSLNSIDMVRDVAYAPECLSKLDEARVYAYNGVATDNFQVYHTSASVVPRPPASCTPTTRAGIDGLLCPIAALGATLPTVTITSSAASIASGQSASLTWSSNNATTVAISQGIGTVAASGTRPVSPAATTTYTVTATNAAGSATAAVTVTVTALPTVTFTASPASITPGASSTLSWAATNATSVTVNQGIGTVTASGTRSVSPAATTTYTITAINAAGAAISSATVTVTSAPTVTFTASPATIAPGAASTLTWTTTNATSVSINQGIGAVTASGTRSVSPTATTTYTIAATNANGSAAATTTVTVTPPPTLPVMSVDHASLAFGAINIAGTLSIITKSQTVGVSFAGGSASWTAATTTPWLQVANGAGMGAGHFTVSVAGAAGLPATGTFSGAVTLTSAGASSSPKTITVTLTLLASTTASAAPFGSFDTPVSGANVAGSIAVTGWSLDDVEVSRVEIWRDLVAGETTPGFSGGGLGNGKVFIANAFFIDGARPDVELAYGGMPLSYRAGWGYLMLTQGLWNQGNGSFTLHAFAYDKDGHGAALGSKVITSSNATATRPFGGIDRPGYGETVTTSFWNFGWALTPVGSSNCTIGAGGVQVSIDSGPLVPVSYGDMRSDISDSFPGFTNSGGAGGAYYIDISALANGTHQIGWYVVDSCGRADGIGSRFFTVRKAGAMVAADSTAADVASVFSSAEAAAKAVRQTEAIEVRRGVETTLVHPGPSKARLVTIGSGERVEMHLPATGGATYAGHQVVNGERRALPLGASLDATQGIFYWEPAAGFLGAHDLEFVATDGEVVHVRAVVGTSVQAAIDTPQSGPVAGPFTVAGWAIDEAAATGAGIDTVHVWAHPATGAAPTFLGVAEYGDARPDIGALFGDRFTGASYSLSVNGLPAGTYDLVVYPHSAVTGDFHGARVVRVTVP